MQKLGVLAEECIRILSGGHQTADSQLTFPQMVIAVGQARDNRIRSYFWENKRLGETDIDASFIKDYDNIPVSLDAVKNMYYSNLPAQIVGIANDLGVYQILWQLDQTTNFVRIPNGFMSLTKGLDVANMQGRNTFFREGTRVYYPVLKKKQGIKSVLMKLIPSASSLTEDDYSYMPSELEQEVIEMVVRLYSTQQQIASDTGNDNIK
jgi:hypothetical protein